MVREGALLLPGRAGRLRPAIAIRVGWVPELGDTLIHLHELHLLQFEQDAAGAFCFRMRADEAARVAALLDDFARARRN